MNARMSNNYCTVKLNKNVDHNGTGRYQCTIMSQDDVSGPPIVESSVPYLPTIDLISFQYRLKPLCTMPIQITGECS